jgi:hypothetical protein
VNCSTDVRSMSVSADGSRFAFSCGGPQAFRGAVMDTVTGATVALLGGSDLYAYLTLSPNGQELYAITPMNPGPSGNPALLRRYAVSTGAVLAETTLAEVNTTLYVDSRTSQLFGLTSSTIPGELRAFDPVTLQELDAVALPRSDQIYQFALDSHQARAYLAYRANTVPALQTHHFAIIDTDTLDLVAQADLGNRTGGDGPTLFGLVVAPRPAAPTGLAATVTGASVQLSWAPGPPPGTALRYVLEAGSGPGLANLASFDVGLQASLTVNAVPPGTYYVRVRPANVTGSGQPSNEVMVTVP